MRPPACVSRGADSSATLEAIPHRCGNRLHRHARQFCATASSTTHSNFVHRQKNPGRSAPTICENVPAVASQQAATGYGILSETSGLGFSRTRLSVILRILARWTRSSIREGCAATKFDRGGPGNSQNGEPFGLASAEPAGCPHQGASLPSSSVASAPISRQSSASGPAPNHLPQAIAIACGSAPAVPTGSRLRPDVVGRIGPGRPG
jgi:hypothetical protein